MLLGVDKEWEERFDIKTKIQINEKIEELYTEGDFFYPNVEPGSVTFIRSRRLQEKRDMSRERIIKGLSVVSIVISVIALLISILK